MRFFFFVEGLTCSIPVPKRYDHKQKDLSKWRNRMVRGAATQQVGVATPLETKTTILFENSISRATGINVYHMC